MDADRKRLNLFGVFWVMKFKFYTLFFLAALFSSHTYASDKGCLFEGVELGSDGVVCTKENGVDILKLIPAAKDIYEANLDTLPTFVISGRDQLSVLEAVGNGKEARYNHLIELPNPNDILHFDEGSAAVKLKLTVENWNLLDVKDVVYRRPDGSEGAGVVCITYEKKIDSVYVAVSQCNSFYEEDVIKLKATLESLDNYGVRRN